MANGPIDPLVGSRYALKGRVVTMNEAFQVLEHGVVYIDAGRITAVLPSSAPPRRASRDSPVLDSRGTIFPGLIELHNHLSYNVLLLWAVPKQFTNRSQWSGVPDYRKLISGPMQVLGTTPGFVEAIVRYVECKCLLAGVTTSRGSPCTATTASRGITGVLSAMSKRPTTISCPMQRPRSPMSRHMTPKNSSNGCRKAPARCST